MQENVIYKSTILNYCMVSISILVTFLSAEELLDSTDNDRPRAGSGVVRMDPLRFLARCRTRRLNQA